MSRTLGGKAAIVGTNGELEHGAVLSDTPGLVHAAPQEEVL